MQKHLNSLKILAIYNIVMALIEAAALILFVVNGNAALYGAFNKEASKAIGAAVTSEAKTIIILFLIVIFAYGITGLLGVMKKPRACIIAGVLMSVATGIGAFGTGKIAFASIMTFIIEVAYTITAIRAAKT